MGDGCIIICGLKPISKPLNRAGLMPMLGIWPMGMFMLFILR